jgi:hypothetical protein
VRSVTAIQFALHSVNIEANELKRIFAFFNFTQVAYFKVEAHATTGPQNY